MILMIRCILYPKCKLFVTSGGKEQAAGIIKEKVQEICNLIPAMDREIDYRPGQTRFSKDQTTIVFKNGSYFDNIAARETSRGKRRHGKKFFMTFRVSSVALGKSYKDLINTYYSSM